MAKIHKDDEQGITTFELESPEAFMQFKKGIDQGEHNWGAHPETNELLKYKSENCEVSRIFVKYGDVHKQVK